MKYPFEFNEMPLTPKALDVLGFTEYWSGSGDSGTRTLDLGGLVGDERLTSIGENPMYLINDIDETCDPTDGYGSWPTTYGPRHYTTKDYNTMYFLHEMYEDIVARRTPEEVARFIEITKKHGVNMFPYIESYLKFKNP